MRTSLTLWAVLAAMPAFAEFKATITASETELGTEDVLEVTVQLTDPPPGATIEWPATPDFERSTRRTATSSSFSKDISTRSETRSFRPTRKGTLTFPAAIAKTPLGTTAETGTLSLKVIEGHLSTAKREKSAKPPKEELSVKSTGDYFIRAELTPASSTLGDPLELSLLLFVRATATLSEIDQISFELPEHVVEEHLAIDEQHQLKTIDGVEYRVIELRKARVLPLSVGTFNVAAPSVRVSIGAEGTAVQHTLMAAPISLEVKPASDDRRAFTTAEGQTLLRRKIGPVTPSPLTVRPKARPVSPIKSVKFKQ